MLTTLTTLTLAAALASPLQDDPAQQGGGSTSTFGRGVPDDPGRISQRMEAGLGFSIYAPKAVSAKSLLRYASEMAETQVRYFFEDPISGRIEIGRRDRFMLMDSVIGVQDFADGRTEAIGVLEQLDAMLGAEQRNAGDAPGGEARVIKTIKMKTIDLDTALGLVNGVDPRIAITRVHETGTLVLHGPESALKSAEELLASVDQPLSQVTLHISLIEATDGANGAPMGDIPAGVAASLSKLVPGKKFRNVGSLLLRGSSGGNARLEVSSSLKANGEGTMPSRVRWSAIARGLDPQTKTLSLGKCQISLDVPVAQETTQGGVTQTNFNGFRSEGLQADLALRADETTIVGSMGGDPIYVSIRFTIDD